MVVPAYDRSRLRPAVVHFGVGGFHRAHQAMYFDKPAELGFTHWGVIEVGMKHPETGEVLSAQDNLFTVVRRGSHAGQARVVAGMVEHLLPADDPDAVRERLSDPEIRLVTLTITADGYAVPDDPERARDSVFGLLVDALGARRRARRAPFTVLSCDNLPDSAAAVRESVMAPARRRDPALARWIAERVTFPGSMADRITPATTSEDRDEVEREFRIDDRWPVITEPFSQWVVEDAFCNDRPPLDRVGVRFVPDVAPYELIKSGLPDGAHTSALDTLRGRGARALLEDLAAPAAHVGAR
ncbi:hypothetical protein ACIGNX_11315 [Actinosynnema sp. NPDC053489]|uniref:hypothetical protein n=1 Tax=Actinosynnema sp. NPDC053489 TaxID=3363916 RepID=UPI0037C57FD9